VLTVGVLALACAYPALAFAYPSLAVAYPAAATDAATGPARAGAQYDGWSGEGNWRATVVVARHSQALAGFGIGFRHGRCSNGDVFESGSERTLKRAAPIDSQGRASYSSGFAPGAYIFTRRGKRVVGRERLQFTVRFAGDRVDGVLNDTFRSPRLSCSSGPVALTAFRDGTPGAPLRDRFVETGRYEGITDLANSYEPFALKVFLPQALMTDFHIAWNGRCSNGYTFHSTTTLTDLRIHGSRFATSAQIDLPPNRAGVYERDRYRLNGRFTSDGYVFRVNGTWRFTALVYRAGRLLSSCGTNAVHFDGTGPLD
jgi:hypothetical protein